MDDLPDAAMRWNTPLSVEHADALLRDAGAAGAATALDLGCGWGELLLRVGRGLGVDSDPALIARATAAAADRELPVRFVAGDATACVESAELVLCIGAAHAWGGSTAALRALRRHVAPGGRLLYGDGCWRRPPTAEALAIFGDDVLGCEELRAAATSAGWRILGESAATQREWDAFESSFRIGREDAAARREEYETVYRGLLGFTYLVLT